MNINSIGSIMSTTKAGIRHKQGERESRVGWEREREREREGFSFYIRGCTKSIQ